MSKSLKFCCLVNVKKSHNSKKIVEISHRSFWIFYAVKIKFNNMGYEKFGMLKLVDNHAIFALIPKNMIKWTIKDNIYNANISKLYFKWYMTNIFFIFGNIFLKTCGN